MSVLLALTGAVAYGLSDFLGGLGSRRTSPWAVAFVASLVGAVAVGLVAAARGGDPAASDLAWGLLGGLGNGVGTVFLYRGLSAGRMAVVGPVSAVGAAVLPVAAGLFTGERPAALVWTGIVVALPGIWLVSREPTAGLDPTPATRRTAAGLRDGVLAGLGFGTLFVALGQVPQSAGLLPVALNQAVAAAVIVAVAVVVGAAWVPRERPAAVGVACGCLGAVATVAFLLAAQRGSLAVAAVVASLYPAVTVVLASALLHERVHRPQALGLALCATAVVLVALG